MTNATPRAKNFPNINTLWARALVDELARCGLRDVCVSPGSRSTPLVVAFYEHPEIRDFSIVDERSSAFFALGLAKATRRPVALLCTSGTAAANYFPAVCEAAKSGAPLIVLSADRPAELHDSGASQSMDQHKLYGDRVRWFHQLAQPEPRADKLRYLRSTACRAFSYAGGQNPGPVHLNIPFRKPLEPTPVGPGHRDFVPQELADSAPTAVFGRDENRPYLEISAGHIAPDSTSVEAFAACVRRARRPLILAGADENGENYRDALRDFAELVGAPIAAEPTSALRHWRARGPNVLAAADLIASSALYESYAPDLIIRTGRAPLLWAAQALVRDLADVEQIVVSRAAEIPAPDHLVHRQFACDEALFFKSATARLSGTVDSLGINANWLETHRNADQVALESFGRQLADIAPLNSARMWDELGQSLPEQAAIFVSNSMATRHLDTFMCRAESTLDLHFNRGLNGIDGIVSTGLGVARGRRRGAENPAPTVIVSGDVALRHDLGALLLAAELGVDATLVVVDNSGGAIFDYLPIAGFESVHERHFTTPPLPIRDMLPSSVELSEPQTWPEFRAALADSFDAPGLRLICVRTERDLDKKICDELRRRVSNAIAKPTLNPDT
jgi:2-succinyl-5-enolpyruvyl-6-hydroxy-3-cyclohexene-1-carboxylate synthase